MHFITKRRFLFFGILNFINIASLVTPAMAQEDTSESTTSPLMMFGWGEHVKNHQAYSEDCWREHLEQRSNTAEDSHTSCTALKDEPPTVTTFSYGVDRWHQKMSDSLWGILGPERHPSLENFRNYIAAPANEGTHTAVLADGSVAAIPSTWHGQLLHMWCGDPHELNSQRFSDALHSDFGKPIADWTYPEEWRRNAAVRHSDVLQQQLVANILKNALHVLNPFLQKVKITVRLPEQPEVVSEATDTDDLPDQQLSPGSSKTNRHRSSSAAAAEAEDQSWWNSFTHAISVKAKITDIVSHVVKITPGLVNKAFEEQIEISVALNENPLMRIGGVSHALIKEVLEKADSLLMQNSDRLSAAEKAMQQFRAATHLPASSAASSSSSSSKEAIPDVTSQHIRQFQDYHAKLYPSATSHPLTREAQERLKENDINKLLARAASEEVVTALSEALTLSQKLHKIKNLFENEDSTLSSLSSPSKMTAPRPEAEQTFLKTISPCFDQTSELADKATQAAEAARETIHQMSELITQTLLPSHLADNEESTMAAAATLEEAVSQPLPEQLESALKPLAQSLEESLQTIQDSAERAEQIKANIHKATATYESQMKTRLTEVHNPQTATGMLSQGARVAGNLIVKAVNTTGQAINRRELLQRFASQSKIKRTEYDLAQERSKKIKAILGEQKQQIQEYEGTDEVDSEGTAAAAASTRRPFALDQNDSHETAGSEEQEEEEKRGETDSATAAAVISTTSQLHHAAIEKSAEKLTALEAERVKLSNQFDDTSNSVTTRLAIATRLGQIKSEITALTSSNK